MQFANETPWPVYAGEVKTKRGFAAQLKKQPLPGHWRPVVSYPNRLNQSRRGTMLVVGLGLLVALFVLRRISSSHRTRRTMPSTCAAMPR